MDPKTAMSTFSSPNDLHRKSEEARENDQLQESLDLIEDAIVEYEDEENFEGVARAMQSKVLSFKHLFLLNGDLKYREFAKEAADESLRIATRHNLENVLSSCYFRLGEVANLFEDYDSAVKNFQKSLDLYNGTQAEKGDYTYHLGEALYHAGDKLKGKETVLKGLSEIRDNRHEVDEFLANVWESGALMKLALLLKNDEPENAKKYLDEAENIINSDNRLVIRKRQLEQAKNTLANIA